MKNVLTIRNVFILIAIVVLIVVVPKVLNGKVIDEGSMKVKFETNKGDIVIELDADRPITAGNFKKLVEDGFYDGTRFHRVINGFMIQGGDPLSKDVANKGRWGTGGPGYNIKDEFGSSNRNDKGTISMANSGPNTGGSQFFINLVGNNFLDTKHPIFGKVIEGMDVVDSIAGVETNQNDQPVEDVIIVKARVI